MSAASVELRLARAESVLRACCFTRPVRGAFVGICRTGSAEYRTSPKETVSKALFEAQRIAAWLRRCAPPGAP